jgi:acyl-coenzyme A thioesterase PaaI-like protein
LTSDVASPRSRPPAAPDRRADEPQTGTETRQRVGRFDFAAHNCFACGQLNAGGLRLALHVDGDVCWTETVVAGDFQGWEGFTHGGVVAAILDEVMAWSLIGEDRLGFTARIEVDFRRPVRTGMPIRAEGWIEDRRRRRFDTVGRIVDAATGDVLAEARAIYLGAPLEQEAALRERYDIRLVAEEAS